jgi:DNA gyrase subunit B
MQRGLDGARLTVAPPMNPDGTLAAGEPRAFEGERLESLVQVLTPLEKYLQILEQRGISLATFLPRATERGLPAWKVLLGGREHWFHTAEEVDAFRKAESERIGRELVVEDETGATAGNGQGGLLLVQELHEVRHLNRGLDELRQRGLETADLLPTPRVAGREPPVRFLLQSGDQRRVLSHLRDLVAEVRRLGEKGLSVTRFKGLGEMDPEELWDTTLDPKHRTLLQVHLDDALEADELFRKLMGEKVEPRRDFIEKHARDVKDIDYHGA